MLDEDNDEDEKDVEFDETSVNREKADAEELSGSRRVSDTFLRFRHHHQNLTSKTGFIYTF